MADSRGSDGSEFFSPKSRFFSCKNHIIRLSAFAINDGGADTLSSAPSPFFKSSGSATGRCHYTAQLGARLVIYTKRLLACIIFTTGLQPVTARVSFPVIVDVITFGLENGLNSNN